MICGIAMMAFAEFGKFREAGLAIPLALALVLAATLTLSPALFRLAGRWAFWPHDRRLPSNRTAESTPSTGWGRFRFRPGSIQRFWTWLEDTILQYPGRIWAGTVGAMLPFAVAGLLLGHHLSYDVIGDLPDDAPSVVGTRVLTQHMPAGMLGPVNLLLVDPQADFRTPAGRATIERITQRLADSRQALGVADARSYTAPLGIAAPSAAEESSESPVAARQEAIERAARDYYLTDLGGRAKVGARFDVILQDNPFSRSARANLERIEDAMLGALPESAQASARLYAMGPTASVRDLETVAQHDRQRIQLLVLGSVFVILVLLLRRLVVPIYLLMSVLFSYYVTLGVTFCLFWALDPAGFTGIDWKVAIFLFTILVAVGEDYNIFLMTRIDEETPRHGPRRGVTEALIRTGPIISSCGIIMAGTFASLLVGELAEMKQLGFALAFGVLVDTFVVRPILVPAFLLMWRRGGGDTPVRGQDSNLPIFTEEQTRERKLQRM